MDVAMLCDTYQRKMWTSMISRKKLNFSIWDALKFKNEKVYYMPYSGNFKFEVSTRHCLHCGKELEVGFRKNEFIVNVCKCSTDSKTYATKEKLTSMFSGAEADNILHIFSDNKTRNLVNRKKYWISQGYTLNEATAKVAEIQTNRSKLSPATTPGVKEYSVRCAEYWIKKGYSESEAQEQVSKYQIGNGLEWYISRYGESVGTKKFNKRMCKWINSYNMALENDPTIIERKTVKLGKASKQSLVVFESIYLEYKDRISIFLGVDNNQEYFLRNGNTLYFYDFTIPELKIIAEFNGSMFHPNTNILTEHEIQDWKSLYSNLPAEVVIANDIAKIKLAESHGYTLLTIWDTDNIIEAQNKIRNLIEHKLNET